MIAHISSGLLAAILAEAARAPDREVCGLLFGAPDRIEAMTPTRNVHADPVGHFEIDPAALIAAHKAQRAGGPRLIGHYHSHPSGRPVPSEEDVRGTQEGFLSLIVGSGVARLYLCTDGALCPVAMAPHAGP